MLYELFSEPIPDLYEVICNSKNCDWQDVIKAESKRDARESAYELHNKLHKHKPSIKVRKI